MCTFTTAEVICPLGSSNNNFTFIYLFMCFLSIINLIKFFRVVKVPRGENAIADIFSLMRGTSLYYSVFD